MLLHSINPYTEGKLASFEVFNEYDLEVSIASSHNAWMFWKKTDVKERKKAMLRLAGLLLEEKNRLAVLITQEMGKRIEEAEAEIEKSSWVCSYYAQEAENMLANDWVETEASKSYVVYQPLGSILAVMPWNFPFWQVLRFAAPIVMAGNVGLLKHASNVQGCALAIEELFVKAGFPVDVFKTLVIDAAKVESVIADSRIKGVSLTGSEYAGSQVAAAAGKVLKKVVLELGGSDPFIVLADADLKEAAKVGVKSRMLTSGQTCIAAKRFIVEASVAEQFIELLKVELSKYIAGDPMSRSTNFAPLAKRSFAEDLHKQVQQTLQEGATCLMGGVLPEIGNFYPPTLLIGVNGKMCLAQEESFGPVVVVLEAKDTQEIIELANDSIYGLGASVWTEDTSKAEAIALQLEVGVVYVNELVKSDPRLPFGGIKQSGFGRELADYGIKEFCNVKTISIK